jgi:hypothetical protein
MDTLCYTQNLQIDGATETQGNRHGYRGTISSTSMNQQAFHISLETLRNIRDQANAGVPIHFNHETHQFQGGMTTSATLNGEKVNAEFYIIAGLNDINSDDIITRMDDGAVNSLSLGFMGGKYKCELCREQMTPYHDRSGMKLRTAWRDDNGHVLGRMTKEGKREMVVTAEVKGKVNLTELSVVGTGADPSAKIIKKLQSDLNSGELHASELNFIAETHNYNLSQLCETLGYRQQGNLLLPKTPKTPAVWYQQPKDNWEG